MNLSVKKIQEVVEIIYQPSFKIFTVNSRNGKDFSKPLGYFVSLGITTSIDTIRDVGSFIGDQLKGEIEFSKVCELETVKMYGQFMNTVTKIESSGTSVDQYESPEYPSIYLDKEKSSELLNNLKGEINKCTNIDSIRRYSSRIGRLTYLINKINKKNDWDSKGISVDGDDFKIFHRKINFIENEGKSLRVGIYIKFL